MYVHKHMWCQIKLSETCDPIKRQFFFFLTFQRSGGFRRQNLTYKVGLRTERLNIFDNGRRPVGIQIKKS